MLLTCSGANAGASSMTTRPPGNSTYKVLFMSSGRQSAGLDAAKTSPMVGGLAARAGCDKKTSAHRIKYLKSQPMRRLLHNSSVSRPGNEMRRIIISCLTLLVAAVSMPLAYGQHPGGQSPVGPGSISPITGSGGRSGPQSSEIPTTPIEIKPDKLAQKALNAATKSMAKAHELEEELARATDPDKKARTREKL